MENALLILGLLAVLAGGCYLVLRSGIPSRFRTLLLDADGTLFDFDRSERDALTEALGRFGIVVDDEIYRIYHQHNDDCWKEFERGGMSREKLKGERFARTFAQIGVSADPEAVTRGYEECLGHYQYPYPGVEEACRKLSRKYDLFLVTNGLKNVQEAKLARTEVPRYCKAVYISEAVGYAKPAKEFFDVIFRDHPEIDPETTLIVGDSLTSDIRGGNNAQIRTCWVHDTETAVPPEYRVDLRVRKFTDLTDLL